LKMPWFSLFRDVPYPTLYPPRKTPVTADVLEAGLIFAMCIIAFSFVLIIPGVRGRERLFYTIRVIVGVFILGCILLVNFGQEWEVAEIHDVPTQYRAGLAEEIHADIGLKIGLRSINITLKTNPEYIEFNNGTVMERINYNERFHWDSLGFVQGRGGFGPFAGLFNREYRAAQLKGLPYPILWIAEYFTIDGEWIRWGRFYRQAGWYSHVMIWLAFPLWILSLILFKMVLLYGGLFSILTGLSLICANLIYACVRNPNELVIPFTDEKQLDTHFGWSFWLCLFNGLLTLVIGIVVIVMDLRFNDKVATFFNFDIAQELEEYYADPSEFKNIADRRSKFRTFTQRFTKKKYQAPHADENSNGTRSTIEILESGGFRNPQADNEQRLFRKRTMGQTRKDRPKPQPQPRHKPEQVLTDDGNDSDDEDPTEDYVNNPVAVRFETDKAGKTNMAFQ